MESIALPLIGVEFPTFTGLRIYMQKFKVAAIVGRKGTPAQYAEMLRDMVLHAGLRFDMDVHLTVDEKFVPQGQKHRRGGAHVDGNFIFDWGGGGGTGWLNGGPGRVLTPEQHKLQYQSPLGGTIIASNFAACDVWTGTLDGIPGQGGDCEHLRDQFDGLTKFRMAANHAYVGNSLFVHEGMPLNRPFERQLVRLTLAPDFDIRTLQ